MKIIQINACRDYMSTGVIVKAIGDVAEQDGMEMYYAYQSCVDSPSNSYQVGNRYDWKWHALWNRITGREGYASCCATKKLLKWMDTIQPDVVHLHNLHSHYVNFNMLCRYLAKKNIPTIVTLHDCWYFTGKCSHYVAVGCDKWKTQCGDCPQLKTEVPSWFFDPTGKVHADRVAGLNAIPNLYIVGCSQWVSNEAKKSLLKPREIHTIYNGVDLSVFRPHVSSFRKDYDLDNRFVVLGMAGKWADPINAVAVDHILRTLDENSIAVIIGCNDKQKQYFEEYHNVITLGYIHDQQDMADVYAAADVFVNLTHADTLPTVNMESIACGTPVITYNCCGSPELVQDGCGYVVPEGDYQAVVDKITSIKRHPCTGMMAVREHFDNTVNYQQYITLYCDVVRSTT